MLRLLLYVIIAGFFGMPAMAQPESFIANNAFWAISVKTPPEIDFAERPKRILIAPLYKVDQLHVARDKKEELIKDCLDIFLKNLEQSMAENLSGIEAVLIKDPFTIEDFPSSPGSIAKLLKENQADILFGIDQFRPQVEKAGVEVVETSSGSKDRTATYLISADGSLRIFNADTLLRVFPFYTSAFLKERKVVSGLLAAGPSLVSNRDEALNVSIEASRKLVERMCYKDRSYSIRRFSMKEFKQLNTYLSTEDTASATAEVNILTEHNSTKVRGRAFVMKAILYHKKGSFDEALSEIEKAIPLTDAGSPEIYRSFLYKYSSARLIKWK